MLALVDDCVRGWHLPSQNCADARGELTQTERFGDVIVGAKVEPRYPVTFRGPRRQHDDLDVRCLRPRPKDTAHVSAAHDWQVQIQDDEVGRILSGDTNGDVATR